jgi:hypothetical protein
MYIHFWSDNKILQLVSLTCAVFYLISIHRGRTVTRGVNRGARADLVVAMEKQIMRCDEPIEPLLRTFFVQENLSID